MGKGSQHGQLYENIIWQISLYSVLHIFPFLAYSVSIFPEIWLSCLLQYLLRTYSMINTAYCFKRFFFWKMQGVRTHFFHSFFFWNGEGRSVAADADCVIEPVGFSIVIFLELVKYSVELGNCERNKWTES